MGSSCLFFQKFNQVKKERNNVQNFWPVKQKSRTDTTVLARWRCYRDGALNKKRCQRQKPTALSMYSSPVICWNPGESWWKMWIHPIYMIKCTTSNPTKPRQWTSRNMTINENLYFKNCWEDFAKPIVYLSARLIDHPWIFCWNFVTFYLHPKRTKHIVYFCFLIFLWKLMYQVDFRTFFQQLRPETFAWGHLETIFSIFYKNLQFWWFLIEEFGCPQHSPRQLGCPQHDLKLTSWWLWTSVSFNGVTQKSRAKSWFGEGF